MVDKKQVELVRELIRITNLGKLNWEATAEENSFMLSFPEFVVAMEEKIIDYNEVVEFCILDPSGRIVDSFDSSDLSVIDVSPIDLTNMFATVRRRVNGADHALDTLLKGLGEIDSPPVRPAISPPDDDDVPF